MIQNKFIIFFLLVIFIPQPLFSASDNSQTVKPVFWGSYSEPYRDQKHDFVSGRYYIVETGMGKSKISQISDTKILRYFKINGVHGNANSGCALSDGSNAISEESVEWNLWEDVVSEDLFWYINNTKITNPEKNGYNGWCYIDIINPEKRAKWIVALTEYIRAEIETTENGAEYIDGFFLDNARIPYEDYADINVESDPTLRKQMYDGMIEIVNALRKSFPQSYIVLNAYNNRNEVNNNQRGLELLQAGADAMMCEICSFKNNSGNFYETNRYIRTINDLNKITSGTTGLNMPTKDVIVFDNIANQNDYAYRMFSLASYLLIANNTGNTYHALNGPLEWYDVPDYPEHTLFLGTPLGKFTKKNNLLVRQYQKGSVVLNPSNSATISVKIGKNKEQLMLQGGGAWTPEGNGGTLLWQPLSSTVKISPNSALIYRTKN